mmetsp:Transcript_3643/g.5593  ORF Transcript_3643/g.5593 Transcript_3643/m.5593 type:complete len:93 (+) Transcript_3643:631-909(+)
MERGVITIDESPSDRFFHEDDCDEEEETNVKSDSMEGPNSGLMDVEALRMRVLMEMLLSAIVVFVCCLVDNYKQCSVKTHSYQMHFCFSMRD